MYPAWRSDVKSVNVRSSVEWVEVNDRGDSLLENGEVYNPLFRFVSKFIMGHNSTLKKYAGFLDKSFRR